MKLFEIPSEIMRMAYVYGRGRTRALARSRRNVPKRHRHGRTQRTRG